MLSSLRLLELEKFVATLFVGRGRKSPISFLPTTACYFVEQPLLSVKKSRISLPGMKRLRGNNLILIRLRLSLVVILLRRYRGSFKFCWEYRLFEIMRSTWVFPLLWGDRRKLVSIRLRSEFGLRCKVGRRNYFPKRARK